MQETTATFYDVPLAPLPVQDPNSRGGSQYLSDIAEMQIGFGSSVFRADQQGIWLGASTFEDAPFSVDMDGNIVATGLTLSSLVGTLDDISNGSTYFKTTAAQVTGASNAATGLNGSGEIIKGFLASQLSSKSLPTTGVRIDNNGIYGRSSGVTTFWIDASTGAATFAGTLLAASGTFGTVTAGTLSGQSISGSTITGSTLSTATSGQRVVLTSTLAQYYNSSGTEIIETYASSNSFLMKGIQSSSSIYFDSGSSGTVAFLTNGTIKAVFDGGNSRFAPFTDGGISLGAFGATWGNLHLHDTFYYQTIEQPIVWYGYASGTSIFNDNTNFSLSHPSTGKYTITHNLGTTQYACVVTAVRGSGAGAYSAKVEAIGSTTVSITIFDDTGTVRDSDFNFILAVTP
jgi:hypothetical protein